jgi:glucuronate isomerase
MTVELRNQIFQELDALILIDPHTHIDAMLPAARNLGDILGYHYYTELAHSAGMPKDRIEDLEIGPKERVQRLIANLSPIQNTIQYSWLLEMCQAFFGFTEEHIAGQLGIVIRCLGAGDVSGGLARPGAPQEPARGGLFDQQFRRLARRF